MCPGEHRRADDRKPDDGAEVATRRGWDVVEVYVDNGIGGANGRDKQPAFDRMLKEASRRKFDVVMAWAIDRMGRSLRDLIDTIEHLEATGVDLYIDQQHIDTTARWQTVVSISAAHLLSSSEA